MSSLFPAAQTALAWPGGGTPNSSRLITKQSAGQHVRPALEEAGQTQVKEGARHGWRGHTWVSWKLAGAGSQKPGVNLKPQVRNMKAVGESKQALQQGEEPFAEEGKGEAKAH